MRFYLLVISLWLFLFETMSRCAATLCYSRDTNIKMRFELRLTHNHTWLEKKDIIVVHKVYYYLAELSTVLQKTDRIFRRLTKAPLV